MKMYKLRNHNSFCMSDEPPSPLWTLYEPSKIYTDAWEPGYKVSEFEHGNIPQVPCRYFHDRFERNFDGTERRC